VPPCKALCPRVQEKRKEFLKDKNFYTKSARGKQNYTLGRARLLLHIVTEAHKTKPDVTKVVYNSNSFPRASPFFSQHPSSPLSETEDE